MADFLGPEWLDRCEMMQRQHLIGSGRDSLEFQKSPLSVVDWASSQLSALFKMIVYSGSGCRV
jgi:hypothetical protein